MSDPYVCGRVEVVAVTPDDWRSHARLRLDMLREAPDAFRTTYAEVAHLGESGWRTRIAGQRHLQARVDGIPLGSVGIWDDPDEEPGTTTLVAMYVVPDARRRGVAVQLVQAVIDDALLRGQERVRLEATSSNTPAIELYARMGFVDTGIRHPHPRAADLHELVMDRPLVARPPDVEG